MTVQAIVVFDTDTLLNLGWEQINTGRVVALNPYKEPAPAVTQVAGSRVPGSQPSVTISGQHQSSTTQPTPA